MHGSTCIVQTIPSLNNTKIINTRIFSRIESRLTQLTTQTPMSQFPTETVASLLMRDLTRDLVMGVEDALVAGAARAFESARGMADGHLPHVVGQMRHFNMNEAFHRALAAANLDPSPLSGNAIVTGRVGALTLARFNIAEGFWINARRSQTRRHMALANRAIEPLVQAGLFGTYLPPSKVAVFFVACFSKSLQTQPEAPVSVQIAVPDSEMTGWLFRESLTAFAARYDATATTQVDLAVPKLKRDLGKGSEQGGVR